MRTKSTNLTLNEGIKEMARRLVAELHHSSLTALVEQLIRDEYERRVEPLKVNPKKITAPAEPVILPQTNPALNETPVRYKIPRK